MFKLQHPQDLITKLFMLEYARELGAELLYTKATPEQRKNMFYKFEDDKGNISVDLNWEALLFNCTILHLESLLKHFEKEVFEISKNQDNFLKKMAEEQMNERLQKPADINLMDFAASKIKESKNVNKIIY